MSNTVIGDKTVQVASTSAGTTTTLPAPPSGRGATGGDQAPLGAAHSTASLDPRILELLKDITDIKKKIEAKEESKVASSAQATAPKEIDWSKITEADIANLNIPIPVYEQETPEFLTVHLKDQNYTARWVHIMPERLGVCLATGYEYVKPEDLDERFPHPLSFDANNHYAHGDVVCLRIHKSRYLGAIRKNYLKTMQIHGKARVHSELGKVIQADPNLADSIHRGAMTLYEPEDMKGREISSELFSSTL
jgi:hypothetical protein